MGAALDASKTHPDELFVWAAGLVFPFVVGRLADKRHAVEAPPAVSVEFAEVVIPAHTFLLFLFFGTMLYLYAAGYGWRITWSGIVPSGGSSQSLRASSRRSSWIFLSLSVLSLFVFLLVLSRQSGWHSIGIGHRP